MPVRERVPISQAALLVIDVQDSFKLDDARWQRRSNPGFELNLTRLIEAFRTAGRPVIFVLHSDADEGFERTSAHYKLMDFLAPLPGERLIHKTTRNCFTSTDLQQTLNDLGVRRIAITGIQTEQCCETTARVGSDLGFDVDFVTEATLTFPIPKTAGETSDELPVDAVIERTEYVLRHRFAEIATVGELERELVTSCHPEPRR